MPTAQLTELLARPEPLLALAPMQDVTDLPFWGLMRRYGGADVYYTEYFRVHPDSHLERPILRSLDENPTGRPAIAQMIGNDIPSLVRSAKELQQHPIAGVDLNLGCPAPIVYKKCAGGGLLRDPQRIDAILGALREAVTIRFTVKTRLGFEDERTIDTLLPIFARHHIDLLTVHGRTVLQMYREGVRYDLIAQATAAMPCPVLANGNVVSAMDAERVLRETQCRGLMIGRGAIRNPWLFDQIRAHLRGERFQQPTGRAVLAYIHDLFDTVVIPGPESSQCHKLKKYMSFLGPGLPDSERFLHDIRRVTTRAAFFAVCSEHLDHDEPMALAK
jgi:nifR3 family TIM-barrel protein